MRYKRKFKKRKSKKEYLGDKVKRAKKSETKEYWLKRFASYCMGEGRKQEKRKKVSYKRTFPRKRYY